MRDGGAEMLPNKKGSVLKGHEGAVLAARFNGTEHEGAVLAARFNGTEHEGAVLAARFNGTEHEGAVLAARFNGNEEYCLSCGKDRTVRLWNPHRGTHITTYKAHGRKVRDVHITSDNSKMLLLRW